MPSSLPRVRSSSPSVSQSGVFSRFVKLRPRCSLQALCDMSTVGGICFTAWSVRALLQYQGGSCFREARVPSETPSRVLCHCVARSAAARAAALMFSPSGPSWSSDVSSVCGGECEGRFRGGVATVVPGIFRQGSQPPSLRPGVSSSSLAPIPGRVLRVVVCDENASARTK
eukprot:5604800-Pyramimonas_sp.AAC.1